MLFCYYSYWLCHAHTEMLYHIAFRNWPIAVPNHQSPGWRGSSCVAENWKTTEGPESSIGREKKNMGAEDWQKVMVARLVTERWKKQKRSRVLGNLWWSIYRVRKIMNWEISARRDSLPGKTHLEGGLRPRWVMSLLRKEHFWKDWAEDTKTEFCLEICVRFVIEGTPGRGLESYSADEKQTSGRSLDIEFSDV